MQTLLIDDGYKNIFGEKVTLAELADAIKARLAELEADNSKAVVQILVNFKFRNYNRTDQAGIELLIWLRLAGIMNHCVLYSFEALHTLLNRKPEHLIATSKGTSFVRLPANLTEIDGARLSEQADVPNLRGIFKRLFNAEAFRHEDANWWGVKCLWDVHKVATAGNFNDPYPAIVQEKLSGINNAVAKFLYQPELVNMLGFIDSIKSKINTDIELVKQKLTETEIMTEIARERQEQIKNEKQQTESSIREYEQYQKHYANTTVEYKNLATDIADLKHFIKEYDLELKRLDGSLKQYPHLYQKLNELQNKATNIYLAAKKTVLPVVPSVKACSILLIDDNAINGWIAIIKHMLPNAKVDSFEPKRGTDINQLYETVDENGMLADTCIKQTILNSQPDIVMLDLRLFDETTKSIDVKDISGVAILKKIRGDYPGLPVLITTASNKIWSYDEVIKWGADAYWVKEGLDEQRDFQESTNNYLHLINTLSKLIGEEYKTLKRFADFVHQVKNSTIKYWWENDFEWLNGEKTKVDKNEIVPLLTDIVVSLRNYLHHALLGYGLNTQTENHAFFASGVINKLASVMERMHGIVNEETYTNKGKLLSTDYGDMRYGAIKPLRNASSHSTYRGSIQYKHLEESIDIVIKYINEEPLWCTIEFESDVIQFKRGKNARPLGHTNQNIIIINELSTELEFHLLQSKLNNEKIAVRMPTSKSDRWPVKILFELPELTVDSSLEVELNRQNTIAFGKNLFSYGNTIYTGEKSERDKVRYFIGDANKMLLKVFLKQVKIKPQKARHYA